MSRRAVRSWGIGGHEDREKSEQNARQAGEGSRAGLHGRGSQQNLAVPSALMTANSPSDLRVHHAG